MVREIIGERIKGTLETWLKGLSFSQSLYILSWSLAVPGTMHFRLLSFHSFYIWMYEGLIHWNLLNWLIWNLLDVWRNQLTPEKNFNCNRGDEAKNGKRALLILFRNKHNPIESSCFNYTFFDYHAGEILSWSQRGAEFSAVWLWPCCYSIPPTLSLGAWFSKAWCLLLEVGHFASLWEGVSISPCSCDHSAILLVPHPILSGVRLQTFSAERGQNTIKRSAEMTAPAGKLLVVVGTSPIQLGPAEPSRAQLSGAGVLWRAAVWEVHSSSRSTCAGLSSAEWCYSPCLDDVTSGAFVYHCFSLFWAGCGKYETQNIAFFPEYHVLWWGNGYHIAFVWENHTDPTCKECLPACLSS